MPKTTWLLALQIKMVHESCTWDDSEFESWSNSNSVIISCGVQNWNSKKKKKFSFNICILLKSKIQCNSTWKAVYSSRVKKIDDPNKNAWGNLREGSFQAYGTYCKFVLFQNYANRRLLHNVLEVIFLIAPRCPVFGSHLTVKKALLYFF